MKIAKATRKYEAWLAGFVEIVPADVELKHQRMAEASFPFLRATYYRWAATWAEFCPEEAKAPRVLAVGDLHIENFGTWRDSEGRLVWGVNDFDEACRLPYTNDLVRLAVSAYLACAGDLHAAAEAIIEGYAKALEVHGRPVVLAEHHPALRRMATARLHDPEPFWEKLEGLAAADAVPNSAARALAQALPEPGLPARIVHRVAGLGSLGRQRFVALAEWRGGRIAREAKSLAPSAAAKGSRKILYAEVLERAVRCPDPCVWPKRRWIVRRLAPDCSRIELADLPAERDNWRLLHAMGWETANVHLGSAGPNTLARDLKRRRPRWLERSARRMAETVTEDWQDWKSAASSWKGR